MNENIDLTKILKDCPMGWKLYSSAFGEVEFQHIELGSVYPIIIKAKTGLIKITYNGKLLDLYDVECSLFPSRDCRDWGKLKAPWYKKEKFDPKTFKPFDKVLMRDKCEQHWRCDFFSHILDKGYDFKIVSVSYIYRYCIPYNDDTKNLVGTTEAAPEYYRYWEE